MTDTQQFWKDEGGREYHARNRVDWRLRAKSLFTGLIDLAKPRSVFEFGCGPGWNLTAIKAKHPEVATYGYDLNAAAFEEAYTAGHRSAVQGYLPGGPVFRRGFDLSFTCGVLIHVPPDQLNSTMKTLIDTSSRWVLCMEYHAEEEEEVEYRGKKGLLWKRNYRRLYEDLGLKHHMSGFLGPEHGFDNVTWTLLTR